MTVYFTTDAAFDEAVTSIYKDRPLILCEGDSWFAYPDPTIGNVPFRIDRMGDYNILNLAASGDEAVNMLSPRQRAQLEHCLGDYAFDMLLFSGGGNDIVAEHLPPLLRRKTAARDWLGCIDQPALAARIAEVRAAYEQLIEIRDRLRPDCVIVTHDYDYPVPSDTGVCGLGPWMKPAMVAKGITQARDQRRIARHLIEQLTAMQQDLAAASGGSVVFVKTSGTLAAGEWANEIHPNVTGFRKIASCYWDVLEQQFPDYTA